jgi:hypothetical protein
MNESTDSLEAKVSEVLKRVPAESLANLLWNPRNQTGREQLVGAFIGELPREQADELWFHLWDWRADAAFLVAFHLAPERFTEAEIRSGVCKMLCHIPYHVLSAAKVLDLPVTAPEEVDPS